MKYQLVIRIPYEAMDDIEAREKASKIMEMISVSDEAVVKLQRLQERAEPIGVSFDVKKGPVAQLVRARL